MTRRMRLFIAGGAVLAVAVAGISWFAFAPSDDMGEGAMSAKSVDEAKVPVSVVLSADARRLNLTIDWNDELDAFRGDDRFTARVMAGNKEIDLKMWKDSRPDVDTFTLEFTEAETTLLLAAVDNGDAVVAVTQQSDTDLDSDSLYEKNYATVLRIQAPAASARPAGVAATPVIQLASMRVAARSVRSDLTSGYRVCHTVVIEAGADLSDCDFHGAYWNSVSMESVNLAGTNLSGAELSQADLSGANMTGVNLTGASMLYVNLYSTILVSANLNNAMMSSSHLNNANLTSATLTSANLSDANMTGVNLTSANLTSAKLDSVTLTSANLTSANLTGANMQFANLLKATMTGANLSDTDLRWVVVPLRLLNEAILDGAKCPEGNPASGTPAACHR
jgi:uncharacterized protein YjbI with pentapeptide repeats